MKNLKKIVSLIITPVILTGVVIFYDFSPAGNPKITYMACIAILMAVWWITEAVPLAVTSLLPVALFPLFGIMDAKDVSATYFNDVIFLFMGGFMIALAMEKWNLHKRIALFLLSITGVSPPRILLGFMFASFFLSMWISNTATVMMMLPPAISIISQLHGNIDNNQSKFHTGLLLGIAYSASIGGIATLVGTPPNLSFVRIYDIYFPNAVEISFANWMMYSLPISIMIFISAFVIIYWFFKPKKENWVMIDKHTFHNQLKELGKITYEEKIVFVVFTILAFLWLFRADLNLGIISISGWSSIFPKSKFINDGTIAIFMAIILFLIPSKVEQGNQILDWKTASKLPWHILLLFGGGFALATGLKDSGLSLWVGENLTVITTFHPLIIIAGIAIIITFLTELTSNTATVEMVLPILAGIAISTNINPLLLMLPATLSGSMAFMLPVATAPNAIVFSTNQIQVKDMAKTGLWLNLVAVLIITLMTYYWGSIVLIK